MHLPTSHGGHFGFKHLVPFCSHRHLLEKGFFNEHFNIKSKC
jgi:hypothetical protein